MSVDLNNKNTKWSEKTTKEKLDMVFVIVAIIGFSMGAYVNYRQLTKK
jgi:hypothetical protein